MNKKIQRGLILILACVMLFGAAVACGDKHERIPSADSSSIAITETNQTEVDGSSTVIDVREEPETAAAPVDQGRFTYFAVNESLPEGLLSVKLMKEGDQYKKDYVIDGNGRVLYAINDVLGEGARFSGDSKSVAIVDNAVYDMNGNLLASPEKDGYAYVIHDNAIGDYVLVAKDVSDAAGDRLAIGVLRTDGTWITEFGTDNALTAYFAEKGVSPSKARQKIESFMSWYGEPDVNTNDPQYRDHVYLQIGEDKRDLYDSDSKAYYDLTSDTVTRSYPHICLVEGEQEFTDRMRSYMKYDPPREFGTGIVDSDGNTVKELLNSYEPFRYFENAVVCKKLFEIDTTSNYIVISKDGEVLYDFEGYDIWDVETVMESHCVCRISGENGMTYLTVFDRSGTPCIEPIECQYYDKPVLCATDTCILLSSSENGEDTILRQNYDGTSKQIHYKMQYPDASISFVLPAYGMIVVCSYHDYYTHSNDYCLNFDGELVMDETTIHY